MYHIDSLITKNLTDGYAYTWNFSRDFLDVEIDVQI